jgi:hypothetical protein
VTRREIWTGTFNKTTQKAQFFCNRSKKQSILSKYQFQKDIYNCDDRVYLCGDLESIALISEASASIPLIVPSRHFNNNEYVDGGLSFASPLTPFMPTFDQMRKTSIDPSGMHFFYVNSSDLHNKRIRSSQQSYTQNGDDILSSFTRSLITYDRKVGIDYVTKHGSSFKYNEGNIDVFTMPASTLSFNEIYPTGDVESVDILTFGGEDVNNLMRSAKSKLRFRSWFI